MEQHLIFRAGGQSFAVPISETDKIIGLENTTTLPDVSSYIVGVQDIEDEVTAIIDLSDRFYQRPNINREEAEIIVVNWKDTRIGWLVEEVSIVQAFDTTDLIDKGTRKIDGLSTSYITAFVQSEAGIIPVLDPHALFNEEKAEELKALVSIKQVKHV